MYTEDYEQEIDLKDLLFVLLYRWRILLLAAVIGAALLGGYKAVKGNAKQMDLPQTESYPLKIWKTVWMNRTIISQRHL